jgi:hypothetical protein
VRAQAAELGYVEVYIQAMLDQAQSILAHPHCPRYGLDAQALLQAQSAKLRADQVHRDLKIEACLLAAAGLQVVQA